MGVATHKAHTLTQWRQMEATSLIQTSTQAQPNINGTTRAIIVEKITHTVQKLELLIYQARRVTHRDDGSTTPTMRRLAGASVTDGIRWRYSFMMRRMTTHRL